jgi:hypothetical protein
MAPITFLVGKGEKRNAISHLQKLRILKRIFNVLMAEALRDKLFTTGSVKSSKLEYHASLLNDSTIDRNKNFFNSKIYKTNITCRDVTPTLTSGED